MSFLRASGLYKSFPVGKGVVQVLRDVNLSVAKGEYVSVQGASGSGKSTLLSILAGLDRSTRGEVSLGDDRLDRMAERDLARLRREKIGFVFQFFHLVPSLTVLENVCLPLAFRDGTFSLKRGRELLEEVGLGPRGRFFPDQISGGEKQRAAIARALINDPAVVFADEPTGNLDSVNGRNVLDLLEANTGRKGRTLILVTHDPDIARRADRRVVLKDGEVAA
ncbi:MAG: ABC transporter ATP-binding protein [Elusimicrobiota bacterium]